MSVYGKLSPWMDLAAEALTSITPTLRWAVVAALLREQLHAPLAGTFAWSPNGHTKVDGYPIPTGYELTEVASRAPLHHPLARHYARKPDRTPHATHEFPADDAEVSGYLEELGEYDIDQHLWIPLPGLNGDSLVVGTCRSHDHYTTHDLELAAAVQPLLTALVTHAEVTSTLPAMCSAASDECHLTAREVAVLELCARGRTTASAARKLGITPRTAHKHLENAYRKLKVHDRLSAVLRAHAAGVLELPAGFS